GCVPRESTRYFMMAGNAKLFHFSLVWIFDCFPARVTLIALGHFIAPLCKSAHKRGNSRPPTSETPQDQQDSLLRFAHPSTFPRVQKLAYIRCNCACSSECR